MQTMKPLTLNEIDYMVRTIATHRLKGDTMHIRQAIHTRYIGPTNFRGSRYKATCQAGSITVPARDELNSDENHVAACRALRDKLDAGNVAKGYGKTWNNPMVAGALIDGSVVHVFGDEP